MGEGDSKTILLVEDERVIAMAERAQLEGAGYRVVLAFDGDAAVRIAASGEPRIDLVLMDIDLGKGIDGTQAATRILASSELPILFLSSHGEKEIVERTERITNYGYVVKNSSFTVLDASIKMAFKLFESNRKLGERELRLQRVFEAMNDGFTVMEVIRDEEGRPRDLRFLDANPAFERQVGLANTEAMGRSLLELFPGTEPYWIERYGRVGIGGKSDQFEALFGPLNKYFRVSAFQIEPGRLGVVFSDINERKRSEEVLRDSEKRFRAIFETNADAIALVDAQGHVLYETPSYARVLGYAPESRVGQAAFSLVHPDDSSALTRLFALLLENPGWLAIPPTRVLHADGSWRWIEGTANNLLADPNVHGIVVDFRDISSRVQAEEELRRSEDKFRSLFNNAEVGMFRTKIDGSEILDANERFLRIFKRSRDEVIGKPSVVHWADPKERESMLGELAERGTVTDFPCRMVDKDGELRHCLTSLRLFPDQGVLEGSLLDITEWKRSEESMKASESRLVTLFEHSPFPIWEEDFSEIKKYFDRQRESGVTDFRAWFDAHPDEVMACAGLARIVDVNETSVRYLGIGGKGEMAGSLGRYFLDDSIPVFKEELILLANGGTRFESSIPISMPTRKTTHLVNLAVVPGREADLGRVLVSFVDISERMKAEATIRSLLAEKEILLKEVHHRIKNYMTTIHSLLGYEAASSEDKGVASVLAATAERILSMSSLYDRIYRPVGIGETPIDLYFPDLVGEILEVLPCRIPVSASTSFEPIVLEERTVSALGIILNELITNTVKHGLGDRKEVSISISARKSGDKVVLAYSDDGIGLPEGFSLGSSEGFGMRLVEALVAQIGGSVEISGGGGTGFVIAFRA
jgi:PAS domain S-box-containing protein